MRSSYFPAQHCPHERLDVAGIGSRNRVLGITVDKHFIIVVITTDIERSRICLHTVTYRVVARVRMIDQTGDPFCGRCRAYRSYWSMSVHTAAVGS